MKLYGIDIDDYLNDNESKRDIGSGPVLRTSNTNTEYDRETQDDEIKMGEYLNILKQMDEEENSSPSLKAPMDKNNNDDLDDMSE